MFTDNLIKVASMLSSGADGDKSSLMGPSRSLAATVTKLAKLAQRLKGGDWVDPSDPMLVAENELLTAAKSIEEAAKRLAALRPKKEVAASQEVSNRENMTFDDLILDSAQSIANATTLLIKVQHL